METVTARCASRDTRGKLNIPPQFKRVLCEMFVRKNHRVPCRKTRPFESVGEKKKHSPMMLESLRSLTNAYLQWSHRKAHGMTDCMCINQPRRKQSRQNACAHNYRACSHWWHHVCESQMTGIIHQFDSCRSRSQG